VDPPGQAMVARSQLLSWFLRTPLLCLRGLAGTLAPGQGSAEAFVDRWWNRGAGVGRPCRWTNRRRAFSGTVLATPARMWLDRVVFRVELSSRTSFSHSLSCVDDPHPHHRFQPDHLSAPALGDIPMDKEVLDVLGPGEFLLRMYQPANGAEQPVDLFIAYFPSQRTGDTIHSPKHCLPGAGWLPVESAHVTLSLPGHAPFPANRYV